MARATTAEDRLRNGYLAADPPRATSTRACHPASLKERVLWVPTALDGEGRKRPRAPHLHGHSYPTK